MNQSNFLNGELLLFDKPLDWTSFDVVNKVRNVIRRAINQKCKVGHAGTLDPKATGLLLIATGKKTKTLSTLQGLGKEYTGTFKLGATTPCYDTEMEENATYPIEHIDETALHTCAQTFIGESEQEVPIFSAVKINGVRSYLLAREGETPQTKKRNIKVHEFEITGIEMPYVHFRVKCSKGTYIRAIANDFGKKLNSGAYLTALRRTQIGEYRIEKAWKLDDFVKQIDTTEKKTA